ncbi:MAG TPA: hypothetical protein VMB05_01590 [Solirubrobacteraceae bacterium]|nr:hypothetical protein [Solirubrobacteraceae bacterium]
MRDSVTYSQQDRAERQLRIDERRCQAWVSEHARHLASRKRSEDASKAAAKRR